MLMRTDQNAAGTLTASSDTKNPDCQIFSDNPGSFFVRLTADNSA